MASNIDTVDMKGVRHCTVLGILYLKHLSKAKVLKDSTYWAQRVAMAGDSYVAWVSSEPLFKLDQKGRWHSP